MIRTARSPGARRVLLPLAGTLSLALVAGCGRPDAPNILLITMDTTRADHCSVHGYEVDTTPNLSRFAEQGARFDLAYSPTSTTGPTHASIFTGLYPLTHRVLKNGLPLDTEFTTLAELLRDEQYQTAAVLGSFALSARFGYGQGFEFYDEEFSRETSSYALRQWEGHAVPGGFDRRADETTRNAVRWLRESRSPQRPFFLFVHYFDPHDPYSPPESYRRRSPLLNRPFASQRELVLAHYDAEIAFTDAAIGRLLSELEQLGLSENTVVVLAGDHGEGLMDHDYMHHGAQIYEESVRVPLLMRWPGKISPMVVAAPVELVDLAPTLFELIGRRAGVAFHGRSLAGALRGGKALDADRPVYLYRRHYAGSRLGSLFAVGHKYGLRAGRWKYIEGPEEGTRELFDLVRDPDEQVNLFNVDTERAEEMARRLDRWRRSYESDAPVPGIPTEDLEKLESLGYTE